MLQQGEALFGNDAGSSDDEDDSVQVDYRQSRERAPQGAPYTRRRDGCGWLYEAVDAGEARTVRENARHGV